MTLPGELGVELLLATRLGEQARVHRTLDGLADMTDLELRQGLPDDAARLAFWIDVYNAAVQHQPLDDVATRLGRWRMFRRPVITIAQQRLSLDAIEHGILRRSRWKLALGYLGNPLPSAFEQAHRLDRVDPRIHFALNCGARSCPPIAAYQTDVIDGQLDRATQAFLSSEAVREAETLRLPSMMWWFIGDFGGMRGLRRFLASHDIEGSGGRIRFLPYDWSPAPGRWSRDT